MKQFLSEFARQLGMILGVLWICSSMLVLFSVGPQSPAWANWAITANTVVLFVTIAGLNAHQTLRTGRESNDERRRPSTEIPQGQEGIRP